MTPPRRPPPPFWQIRSSYFVAGFTVRPDRTVQTAAPIIGWAAGHDLDHVLRYCRRRRWACLPVEPSR
jgi:hypothetical protein